MRKSQESMEKVWNRQWDFVIGFEQLLELLSPQIAIGAEGRQFHDPT